MGGKKKCNTCAVAICPSERESSYHKFPTKDPDLLAQWIKACHRKDFVNVITAKVCSDHFAPDCYERDFQNELLGLPLRRILKKTSVPTLNLLPDVFGKLQEDAVSLTTRYGRQSKRRKFFDEQNSVNEKKLIILAASPVKKVPMKTKEMKAEETKTKEMNEDPATLKQRIAELEKIVATQRKELFELRKFKIDTLAKRLKKK